MANFTTFHKGEPMATNGTRIYNLFYQTGAGYRMYVASFTTKEKAVDDNDRRIKQGRGIYKKSHFIVRVGKLL